MGGGRLRAPWKQCPARGHLDIAQRSALPPCPPLPPPAPTADPTHSCPQWTPYAAAAVVCVCAFAQAADRLKAIFDSEHGQVRPIGNGLHVCAGLRARHYS